uniref:IFNL4 n=1 Tax=Pongo abelii TaxID=9601 RepID=A0A8I5TLQ7_PONAB
MRPSVWAAVAAGLWVPCTVGAATPRRCLLSHYRSLQPRVLAAVKALRNPPLVPQEEEALSWRPRNCSVRPRRASCARLRHVARSIADAQAVLSCLHRPELLPGASRFLEPLAAAGRDVAACLELARPGSSRKVPGAQRRRHKPRRADSPRCREASVIFNLLRLLIWELRRAAHSGPCLRPRPLLQHGNLHAIGCRKRPLSPIGPARRGSQPMGAEAQELLRSLGPDLDPLSQI